MRIDGQAIAQGILHELKNNVDSLKRSSAHPTLAVILVGDDPASISYIKQKQKAADTIGASVKLHHVPSITGQELEDLIQQYNADPLIHGLIVQRPLAGQIENAESILNRVDSKKDVDGFVPDSPFDAPVAAGVGEILKHISGISDDAEFFPWLKTQSIVIVGRGETAGAPIARYFVKRDCATSIIHSQTPNPQAIMKSADILISCVGKSRVVTQDAVKPGAILIGVGIGRDDDARLEGDYKEEEIKNIAGFYTPTPGGVGPVNVACLMKNLVQAAS